MQMQRNDKSRRGDLTFKVAPIRNDVQVIAAQRGFREACGFANYVLFQHHLSPHPVG
jgi:hypothetical protein